HPGKAPQGIAFVHQLERAFALKRGAQVAVCRQSCLFTDRVLLLGRRDRKPVDADGLQARRRGTFRARGEQLDLHPLPRERAEYFLYMDRAAFAAEDRHAPIRADIGDTHHLTSSVASTPTPSPAWKPPTWSATWKRARRRAALRRMSNSASIRRRAWVASCTRRAGFVSNRSIAAANASGSHWGTINPVSPSRTTSGMPVTL